MLLVRLRELGNNLLPTLKKKTKQNKKKTGFDHGFGASSFQHYDHNKPTRHEPLKKNNQRCYLRL